MAERNVGTGRPGPRYNNSADRFTPAREAGYCWPAGRPQFRGVCIDSDAIPHRDPPELAEIHSVPLPRIRGGPIIQFSSGRYHCVFSVSQSGTVTTVIARGPELSPAYDRALSPRKRRAQQNLVSGNAAAKCSNRVSRADCAYFIPADLQCVPAILQEKFGYPPAGIWRCWAPRPRPAMVRYASHGAKGATAGPVSPGCCANSGASLRLIAYPLRSPADATRPLRNRCDKGSPIPRPVRIAPYFRVSGAANAKLGPWVSTGIRSCRAS